MIICHVNRLERDVFMNSDFQRICNDANIVVKPVENHLFMLFFT